MKKIIIGIFVFLILVFINFVAYKQYQYPTGIIDVMGMNCIDDISGNYILNNFNQIENSEGNDLFVEVLDRTDLYSGGPCRTLRLKKNEKNVFFDRNLNVRGDTFFVKDVKIPVDSSYTWEKDTFDINMPMIRGKNTITLTNKGMIKGYKTEEGKIIDFINPFLLVQGESFFSHKQNNIAIIILILFDLVVLSLGFFFIFRKKKC